MKLRNWNVAYKTIIYIFLLASFSCRENVSLPSTPLFKKDAQYAVVKVLYAKVYGSKTVNSSILFPLRQGAIMKVVSSERSDGQWYLIQKDNHIAWIAAKDVQVSSVRQEAEVYVKWLLHREEGK